MKILHLCDHYRPLGGAEKLLFDTLLALEAAGVQNTVVMHDYPENRISGARKEYIRPGLDAQPGSAGILSYLRISLKAKKQLAGIIKHEKPDLIHVHNLQNPFIFSQCVKLAPVARSIHDPRLYCFTDWRLLPKSRKICPYPLGARCVTEGCVAKDLLLYTLSGKRAIFKYLHYLAHKKADRLILESKAMISCILQNGYKEEQVALLPNFTVTHELFEVQERNKKYSVPEENSLVFVGRASYEKGLTFLLEAVSRLKVPFKLYLVTGGPEMPVVYQKIKELKLEDRVILPGVLSYEETRKYYNKAALVVVPSVWLESFCLVGLEAMANAKPVVAYKTGGISDWLLDGSTGLLAECGNIPELAEKIEFLLKNKETAVSFGLNGFNRVKELYSKEVYIPRLIEIYKETIAGRDKR